MLDLVLFLALMNAARSQPLTPTPQLQLIAQERVEWLCNHPLSHAGLADFFAGTNHKLYGENLAAGFKTAPGAYNALMRSPTHKANIEDPYFKHVGVAQACGIVATEFSD